MPCGEGLRHARAPPSSRRVCGRAMRLLPHADDDLYGRPRASGSFHAHPAPRPHPEPRHAQRLQQMPCRQGRQMGGRGAQGLGHGRQAGRADFCGNLRARRRRRPRRGRGFGRGGEGRGPVGHRPRQRLEPPERRGRPGGAGGRGAIGQGRRSDDPRGGGRGSLRRRRRDQEKRAGPAVARPDAAGADAGRALAGGRGRREAWRRPISRRSNRRSTIMSRARCSPPSGRNPAPISARSRWRAGGSTTPRPNSRRLWRSTRPLRPPRSSWPKSRAPDRTKRRPRQC